MEYSVRLTSYSLFQIQEIVSYISKVLMAPETAAAWTDCLEKQIAEMKANFFQGNVNQPMAGNIIRKITGGIK